MDKVYVCIDLKSFYASVECRERNLNPLTTNLVVADSNRTEKTICLAVTPSLKVYGIPGRVRLFEVIQKVKEINDQRKKKIGGNEFVGKSCDATKLKQNPNLELDYIIAPPRMAYYMQYSTKIYQIYLKYVAQEDIFSYSIDEVFCDVTSYLKTYQMTARELVTKMLQDVYKQTGMTATAGIGTNLYLAKIAMDIGAKHVKPNEFGVRIAGLNEMTYRKMLWNHQPITDFWRVGKGYAKKLAEHRMYTMGDVARCSIKNEELLYRLFGINAELLIDHSWGWEPCTMDLVKSYKPEDKSISSGQVLHCPYDFEKTRLIVKEMTDLLVLELVEKNLVTSQMVLTIGYDVENLTNPSIRRLYQGEVTEDRYGRAIPKHAHGTINLENYTSSTRKIMEKVMELYDRIMNKNLLVRRINVTANHIINENDEKEDETIEQLNLFVDYKAIQRKKQAEKIKDQKEKSLQHTIININRKYGKNAILKGMNFESGGTTRERNQQIGGHKA